MLLSIVHLMVLSRDLDAVPCTLRLSIAICGQVNKSEQGLPYCCCTFLFIPPVSSPALRLPFASLPLTELKPPLKLASLTAGQPPLSNLKYCAFEGYKPKFRTHCFSQYKRLCPMEVWQLAHAKNLLCEMQNCSRLKFVECDGSS